MSIIAQSYLIPLISERYGRRLTKLLSQENKINFYLHHSNVLHLKSRTFCVVCLFVFLIHIRLLVFPVKNIRPLMGKLEGHLTKDAVDFIINI